MKPRHAVAISLGALLCPLILSAQEPAPTVHAVYYQCDQAVDSRADEVVRESFAPVFDLHLQAGRISAWGWIAHRAGGPWRRVLYWIAPGRDALLDATDRITEELNRNHPEASQALATACPLHDDYIWRSVAASEQTAEVGLDRPTASLSTYYECEMAEEARADTLVSEFFAPVFDRHVAAGHIKGWSWLAHDVGGKLRRLAIFDGLDHKTILNGRDMIISELSSEAAEAMGEFSAICDEHVDYMWNILMSRP